MDFTLSPEVADLRMRVREFVEREIVPLEADPGSFEEHENIRLDLLEEVRAKVKAAGLWAPQMPRERGGLGLNTVGMAALYEEMNRSIFGPVAFNCAAPDDGNMFLLNRVATEAQKVRWLDPVIDGRVRSSFAMTEPAPGAGSDPSMMRTTATKQGDHWVIHGHKWFITGGGLAQHFILIAKTSDDDRRGLTAFLFDRDQPGWEVVRRIPIMGPDKAIDTAIQLCGARGYSKDTPLEWMYRYARQARLVDGASEVHKMVLARQWMQQRRDFWNWE